MAKIVGTLLGATALVVLFIYSPLEGQQIYNEVNAQATAINSLQVTTDIRYIPMEVAQYIAKNKVQQSEINLGDFDATYYKGQFVWMAPRQPNGLVRSISSQTDGIEVVYDDGSTETINQTFAVGEGMYITDNIYWKLRSNKYWVEYPEIYYQVLGGQVVAVAPEVGYRWSGFVMVPYWAGDSIVTPDGKITSYSPAEAQALGLYRAFPETLALRYTKSFEYKNGIINALLIHKDQLRVPIINNSENQMPYLMPVEGGLKWVLTTEPNSANGFGIFNIFIYDAITGKCEIYTPDPSAGFIGPNRAWDIAKLAFPSYSWDSSVKLIEPRPVFTETGISWMLTVTTPAGGFSSGTPTTILVDAKTTVVQSFSSRESTLVAIEGGIVPPPSTDPVADLIAKINQEWAKIQDYLDQLNRLLGK